MKKLNFSPSYTFGYGWVFFSVNFALKDFCQNISFHVFLKIILDKICLTLANITQNKIQWRKCKMKDTLKKFKNLMNIIVTGCQRKLSILHIKNWSVYVMHQFSMHRNAKPIMAHLKPDGKKYQHSCLSILLLKVCSHFFQATSSRDYTFYLL